MSFFQVPQFASNDVNWVNYQAAATQHDAEEKLSLKVFAAEFEDEENENWANFDEIENDNTLATLPQTKSKHKSTLSPTASSRPRNLQVRKFRKPSLSREDDDGEQCRTQVQLKQSKDSYDVSFEHGPIGLELETDWYGRQAVVKGFKKVHNKIGPAETAGIIRIGDILTSINGKSCLHLSFQQTLQALRDVSDSFHTLHFKSLEAAGDLSIYNQDLDIQEARMFIHQQKEGFYHPLLTDDGEESQEMVYGCVERRIGEHVISFNFHREDTGEFLLACSCSRDKNSDFIFHTVQNSHLRTLKDIPVNEDSAVYLGMLSRNFFGTEFTLHDHRVTNPSVKHRKVHDLGLIVYDTNILGRIPNFMKIVLARQNKEYIARDRLASPRGEDELPFERCDGRNPRLSDRYKIRTQSRKVGIFERLRSLSLDDIRDAMKDEVPGRESTDRSTEIVSKITSPNILPSGSSPVSVDTRVDYGAVEQQENADLLIFQTMLPSWNPELSAWTLNFNGRVKQASKKNFLIVGEEGNEAMEEEFGDEVVFLRFGKMTKTRFTLDFRAPFSPIMALAIAMTAFANKKVVT